MSKLDENYKKLSTTLAVVSNSNKSEESFWFSDKDSQDSRGRKTSSYDGLLSSILDLSSNSDEFSKDSDHVPRHYKVGNRYDKKGNVVNFETKSNKKDKHEKRMKDFHNILSKYHVCILPNVN